MRVHPGAGTAVCRALGGQCGGPGHAQALGFPLGAARGPAGTMSSRVTEREEQRRGGRKVVGGLGWATEQREGDGKGEEGLKGRKTGGSRERVDDPNSSPHPNSTFPVRRVGTGGRGDTGRLLHARSIRHPGGPSTPRP